MIEIIFTSRPISWKPISWVNAITRAVTRSPFDHVSLKYRSDIYESTAKDKLNPKGGVHRVDFKEWIKYRKGSYLFIYEVDLDTISFNRFKELEYQKYDYPANIYHLLGMKKMLKKRPNKRVYCSELIASMMGMKDSYSVTPTILEDRLRKYESYIERV